MSEFTSGIPIESTPVLIIGASMIGMTLSALLAKHGIKGCIAVEKHASTAIHPRAALFHPRTMQIYRELGLYDAMCVESGKHYDQHAGIVDVESLAGKFIKSYMSNMNEGIKNLSPTVRLFLTQQMFEPMLRQKAIEDGADLRFSTEMVDFQQDGTGVTALLKNTETGAKTLVRAQYMIACDGNRSTTRSKLGIDIQGHGLLSHSITIYFNADLGKYVKGKYNGVIYVTNPDIRGFFRLDKNGTEGFLVVFTVGKQGTEESRFPADGVTQEKAGEYLRAAIGADVDFEVTLISKWRAVCDIAKEFRKGRVYLAGDAAHTVSPHGGFGGNTGIQDAHNLAWKMALVLKGKANPALTEQTYHTERFPFGKKTVDQVFERYLKRSAPELHTDDIHVEEEIPEPHLELGYRYHSRALDTTTLGNITEDPATATSAPGSLARHIVIGKDDKGEDIPIANYFGVDFVLLTGPDGDGWVTAAKGLQAEADLPEVQVHRIDSARFCERYGISPAGAVLVRPDSVVAWRSETAALFGRGAMGVPDPSKTLVCLMHKLLCLTPTTSSAPNPVSDGYKATPASLATALFIREKQLQAERERVQRQLEQIDSHLADVNRLSKLQDEMALLAMKVMPEGERPPEYSHSECLNIGKL